MEDITAGSTIADLNTANPASGDQWNQADDHIRNLKKAVKQTFVGISATVSSNAAELNLAHKGGTVSGGLTVKSELSVIGAGAFKSGLSVSGSLTVWGSLYVAGRTSAGAVGVDTLSVSGTAVINRLAVNGNAHFSATISGSIKEADHARSASYAISSGYAVSAGFAASAQYATSALVADVAKSACAVNGYTPIMFKLGFNGTMSSLLVALSSTMSTTGIYHITHNFGTSTPPILMPWTTSAFPTIAFNYSDHCIIYVKNATGDYIRGIFTGLFMRR